MLVNYSQLEWLWHFLLARLVQLQGTTKKGEKEEAKQEKQQQEPKQRRRFGLDAVGLFHSTAHAFGYHGSGSQWHGSIGRFGNCGVG